MEWVLQKYTSLLTTVEQIFQNKEASAELLNLINLFTVKIYREVSSKENDNLICSPFSLQTLLALTLHGCKDQTAEEIRKVLSLPNDQDFAELGMQSLLSHLRSRNFTLDIVNKMYVKEGFAVDAEFQSIAARVFKTEVENINFEEKIESATKMNRYVEEKTKNRIRNLVDPESLNTRTRVILIDALYFKADWLEKFPLGLTEKRNFYKNSNDIVEVDAMDYPSWKTLNYKECDLLGAKFLELTFQGGEASMVFILPNEIEGLKTLETKIDQFLPVKDFKSEAVYLKIPKFKVETNSDFKQVLQKLDVTTAFTDFEADLTGISGDKSELVINQILQTCFIDVNEEGVEAAAAILEPVGYPLCGRLEPPKQFYLDHPFMFYIQVKKLIIFVGRVTEPIY